MRPRAPLPYAYARASSSRPAPLRLRVRVARPAATGPTGPRAAIASATPTTSPSRSATHAPPGSVRQQRADAQARARRIGAGGLGLLAEAPVEVLERARSDRRGRPSTSRGRPSGEPTMTASDRRLGPRCRTRRASFKLGGHRLAYTTYGEGPRVTVLLHGLLFSQRMHDELARALADRGHRVVTLDLLGHGASDRPPDMWRYSMSEFGARGDRAARPPRGRARRS